MIFETCIFGSIRFRITNVSSLATEISTEEILVFPLILLVRSAIDQFSQSLIHLLVHLMGQPSISKTHGSESQGQEEVGCACVFKLLHVAKL